jgi:hypothetical protein
MLLASRFSLLAALFLTINFVYAQGQDSPCGLITEGDGVNVIRTIDKSLNPFCDYSVDFIRNGCLETYISVNVHYFVDDDCEGKTAAKISWQQQRFSV